MRNHGYEKNVSKQSSAIFGVWFELTRRYCYAEGHCVGRGISPFQTADSLHFVKKSTVVFTINLPVLTKNVNEHNTEDSEI